MASLTSRVSLLQFEIKFKPKQLMNMYFRVIPEVFNIRSVIFKRSATHECPKKLQFMNLTSILLRVMPGLKKERLKNTALE
jgi:hypothetical protein